MACQGVHWFRGTLYACAKDLREFIMNWKDRIETDQNVLAGRPAIKGTRLPVSFILELLAAGSSETAILANYPRLCVDDIRACLLFASESLEPRKNSPIDKWIKGECCD